MTQEKVTINCPECGRTMKIKVKETVSELTCGTCGYFFKTQYGKVILDSTHYNSYKQQTKSKEKEPSTYNTARSTKKSYKKQSDNSTGKTIHNFKSNKNSKHRKFAHDLRFWKAMTVILGFIVFFVSYSFYQSKAGQRTKEKISTSLLTMLKEPQAPEHLNQIKKNLEKETKSFFELFVESQLYSSDTISKKITEDFLKSIQEANEIIEKRKYYSVDKNSDTLFFYIEYIPTTDGKSYKLKADLSEFMQGS